jgi:hypothetical protein
VRNMTKALLVAGAALVLGLPGPMASAQPRADMSASASNGGEGLRAYQEAEQRLAQALNNLQGGAQGGSIEQARQAVINFQQRLTEVPDGLRSSRSYQQLLREVTEANGLFQNGNPDATQARRELEQVVAVTSQFRAEAGLESSTPGGGPVRDPAAGSAGVQQRSLGGQAPAVVDGQTGSGATSAPASSGGR